MALDLRIAALGCLVLAGAVAAYIASDADLQRAAEPAPTARAPQVRAQAPAATPSSLAQAGPAREALPPAVAPAAPRAPAHATAPAQPATLPATEGTAGAGKASNPNFTHFRVGERNVKRIFADGAHVWVATSGGAVRYNSASDEYRLFDTRSGLRSNAIVYIGKLAGRLAVGSYGGGLALLRDDGTTWDVYGRDEGLADDFVSDATMDVRGDAWIASRSGVLRVRGGAFHDRSRWQLHTVESTQGGLPSNRVYALAAARTGELWAATEGGVARFQQGAWRHWARAKPVAAGADAHQRGGAANPNFIVAVAIDRAGTVWAGSMGGGLARFEQGQWTYYTRADGLPGDNVFALHSDDRRQLWIGTDQGLARLQGGNFKVLTTRDGLFNNAVFAVASTAQGLWAGSYGGVARIRGVN